MDKNIIDINPRLEAQRVTERRTKRCNRILGAFTTIATVVTGVSIGIARSNGTSSYVPQDPVCATTVDTGETLWGITGQIVGQNASDAEKDKVRHEVAFNNGYQDSDHLGIGTNLGLTAEECKDMEVHAPDQITGYAE